MFTMFPALWKIQYAVLMLQLLLLSFWRSSRSTMFDEFWCLWLLLIAVRILLFRVLRFRMLLFQNVSGLSFNQGRSTLMKIIVICPLLLVKSSRCLHKINFISINTFLSQLFSHISDNANSILLKFLH